MDLINFIKNNLATLPYFIGKPISLIPYQYRPAIGKIYKSRVEELSQVDKWSTDQKKRFVFEKVKLIARYAYKNIPFYTKFYKENNVNPTRLNNFYDLIELPIITKSNLQSVPLEERSVYIKGRSKVNTGGSSGHPLEFYIEPSSVGHEWAHMHHIWQKLGFKQSDLKIVFGGRSDVKNIVQYDSVRHQLNVDLYAGWSLVADALLKKYTKFNPQYLHGYPSSIFDFIIWLDTHKHPLFPILRQSIKGLFLGSEFPSPQLRSDVENLLNCKSVSWYGHTERSVLGYEKYDYGVYSPFLSYGYAEVVDDERLVCTSYYNKASPLIRYDTGDLVSPNFQDDLLFSFSVDQGRDGEYIIDKTGNKIFLTGLIFGRHHELFDLARHVQIKQIMNGEALVLVVPRNHLSSKDAEMAFDNSNVDISFSFQIISEPIMTVSGKVPLLVR